MTTMSAVLDQVRAEAGNVNPRDAALAVVSIPFFIVGAIIGGLVRAVWVVATWMWAMGLVGYRVARGSRD